MAIAIVLIAIIVGSVLFHWFSPWWVTPLASHWREMDSTLAITVLITGLFFVVINLFVVWALLRYRHRAGSSAAYQPVNHRLERWLIGFTSIGIAALLAPGLAVYAKYVQPPTDAMVAEVLGQQWQWRYRFPGADGKLGRTDARFVGPTNLFGLDPADAHGQDDLLVMSNELHLPLGRPVKMLLRSHDVLHDYYAPAFRARMNMVPGLVTWFWMTPTVAGRHEVLCAQLCGVGHPDMRGMVVVEDEAAFHAWQGTLPTFARSIAPAPAIAEARPSPAAEGRALAQAKGCIACHSVDGSASVGPGWRGLYGRTETLADGTRTRVDETFLDVEIRDPKARLVRGYPAVMPTVELTETERGALIAYIRSLAEPGASPR